MEVNLVSEAVKFMILGMGTVFVFLVVMIMCMNLLSKIVHKYMPDAPAVVDVDTASSSKNSKVAAIVAAIMHHNQVKQG